MTSSFSVQIVRGARKGTSYTVIVDEADLAAVQGAGPWFALDQGNRVYVYRKVGDGKRRRLEYLHRFLTNAPKGLFVDHKSGATLDNRRCNLRIANPSENRFNVGKTRRNRSGFKGVSYDPQTGLWKAQIKAYGTQYYLGAYDSPEAAHEAYVDGAEALHGSFARVA